MPIFEYRCRDCNEIFEELVLSSKKLHVKCPQCGGKHVNQLISRFAAHVSGGKETACFNRDAGICQAAGGAMA